MSSVSLSPTPLRSPLPPSSTAASSPPAAPDSSADEKDVGDDDANDAAYENASAHEEDSGPSVESLSEQERVSRLNFILQQSSLYAQLLGENFKSRAADVVLADEPTATPKGKGKGKAKAKPKAKPKGKGKGKARAGTKRSRADADESDEESGATGKRTKIVGADEDQRPVVAQPALLSGATLKDYQLQGVQWMVGLDEAGVSGILADEMGLGKTIQTIAFIAYLRTRVAPPFLIVGPLGVLHNWQNEFKRFAPDIPTVVYHGPDRRTLQRGELAVPPNHSYEYDGNAADTTGQRSAFPVVLTTYEMVVLDRKFLARHQWGYVIVDEGHRLKNAESKLMAEIKKLPSRSRLLLTGTPLQNNLGELWSLLNFILPDIFTDAKMFQNWFDKQSLVDDLSSETSANLVTTLHGILKPFLLRRLKVDVLGEALPPKKEYVLYAPLSARQREVYDAIVHGRIREYLIGSSPEAAAQAAVEEKAEATPKKGRRRAKVNYNVDGSDEQYFKELEAGKIKSRQEQWDEQANAGMTQAQIGARHAFLAKLRKVNNMHLENKVVQLRKVCTHPFLFDWPIDANAQPVLGEELVDASGKMMVLERLLDTLFARGHKVLVFSQFVKVLNIIEDWAVECKGWDLCRIDGGTSVRDRRAEMERFQTGGDAPDAPRLFLLSTRAGGLGINLTAADTVVFFDQDWNPQADVQAQDRAHRIGQTKPVLVFRLVTKHTIEAKIMQRAGEKRQLEALVIAKDKFKMPLEADGAGGKRATMAELATELLALEGERIEVVPSTREGRAQVLSDAALDALLDRRPEVFARRAGAAPEKAAAEAGEGARATFEAYEAPADEGNDALARTMERAEEGEVEA